MSTTPPSPSDGDQNGPVEPANGPVPPLASSPLESGEARNGTGVAALVCGGLAALFSIWFFPLGVLVLGAAAVVLGIMGLRRAKRGEATNKSQAAAGLALGIVGMVIFGARTAAFVSQHREELTSFNECVQAASSDEEREQCQRRFEEEIGR
ncbi:MAG: DUF4190 domain-containing protein [Actinobacteria bacterium]|nr:DUF4190 domain-containing protein [Actinomycetota bacterium]